MVIKNTRTPQKNNVLFFFLFALISYMMFTTLTTVFEINLLIFKSSISKYAQYIPLAIFAFFVLKNINMDLTKIELKSAAFFAVYVALRNLYYAVFENGGDILRTMFIETLLWAAILFIPVHFYFSDKSIQALTFFVGFDVILGALVYYLNIDGVIQREMLPMAINSVYYVLLLVPFIFMMQNKTVKFILLTIVTLIIIYSDKATTFVTIVAVLVSVMILSSKKQNKSFIVLILGLAVLLLFMFYKTQIFKLGAVTKIENMNETGASGRFDIIKNTIINYKHGTIAQKIFGSGYNAVSNKIGISAHNDFLEVLYDYGIIGVTAYVLMVVKFIKTTIALYIAKDKYAMPMVASVVSLLIVSMSSHLIFIPRYTLFMALLWAIVYTHIKENGIQNTSENGEIDENCNPSTE